MIALRLAIRNLFRSPRRSMISMAAVVVGIGAFILGEGFISGVEENIKHASIEGLTGHVLARPAGYPGEGFYHPVDELLAIDADMRRFLDAQAQAWTERILFSPIAAVGEDHFRVRAIGYDPDRDAAVFSRQRWRIEGVYPDPSRDEVLVADGVARLLNVRPGDVLILQVRTHQGAINALEVNISGILTTGMTHIDLIGVLMPLQLAQRLVSTQAPTHLAVRLSSREAAGAFKDRLAEALGAQAEVMTWQEDARDLLSLQAIRRRALQFVVLVLLILAAFGMANTILMAAHERVREIGTLRAMGMTMGGVVALFVFEGLILGLVGSALGALWGGGLAAWWAIHPIDMGEMLSDVGGSNMAFSALIYTRFSMEILLMGIASGVAISVLASLYPARMAARMPPAEAARAE